MTDITAQPIPLQPPGKRMWVMYVLYVALLLLGGAAVLLQQAWNREADHDAKVKKLEADVRTYAGKYLDLQEANDGTVQDLQMANSALDWRAQQAETALKACQAKPESRATVGNPKK